jgi:ELWxxDGT repeat protein
MSGQTFRYPGGMTVADGSLIFSAQVSGTNSDREVYKYDAGAFTKLTSIPSANTNPYELTWYDGRVVFAAQDAPDGPTSDSGRVGREVWQVQLHAPHNPSVMANIGQPDTDPTTVYTLQLVGFELVNGILVPIYEWVETTVPGNVKGSFPYELTVAGEYLYFSANDGSSGRELWRSDGVTAERVIDLAPGSTSSFPYYLNAVDTASGPRLFFVSSGTLYVTDGTEENTYPVPGAANIYPYQFTVAGDKLFFQAQGRLWVATEDGATRFDALVPPPLPLTVSVLAGEGDARPTEEDILTPAVFSQTLAVSTDLAEFDVTEAVRAALARGYTRITVRVENTGGDEDLEVLLAGLGQDGRTGLEVMPRVRGLVADLYTEQGRLVAQGRSIIDMRNLDADGYYLRVYNPHGPVPEDVDFQITIDAPSQGYSHPGSDRDRIWGNEGEDILVGNEGIDRLYGQSGRDRFVAEPFEVRDLDHGEKIDPVAVSERSDELPRQTDALIGIWDERLRIALARALGYPVTRRYDSDRVLCDVGRSCAERQPADRHPVGFLVRTGVDSAVLGQCHGRAVRVGRQPSRRERLAGSQVRHQSRSRSIWPATTSGMTRGTKPRRCTNCYPAPPTRATRSASPSGPPNCAIWQSISTRICSI